MCCLHSHTISINQTSHIPYLNYFFPFFTLKVQYIYHKFQYRCSVMCHQLRSLIMSSLHISSISLSHRVVSLCVVNPSIYCISIQSSHFQFNATISAKSSFNARSLTSFKSFFNACLFVSRSFFSFALLLYNLASIFASFRFSPYFI